MRALAAQLAPDSVQVNACARAGWTRRWPGTGSTGSPQRPVGPGRSVSRGDAGRAARPDDAAREIAGTVAWLLSPDARGVTGQAIDSPNRRRLQVVCPPRSTGRRGAARHDRAAFRAPRRRRARHGLPALSLGSHASRERARAVVIGGGVGGCSILYWLTRLGWDDVLLVERADLTSGSTFHSAGLVGQLRGVALADADDDGERRALPHRSRRRWSSRRGGVRSDRCGSPRRRSGSRRSRRQAGWAKTFGLPLELISPAEAQAAVPADVDRGRPRRRVSADRRLHRPQPAHVRARRGCAASRRRDRDRHASDGHPRAAADESRPSRPTRAMIETAIVINAGGMYAGEIGALAGVTVPIIPMAHEYLVLRAVGSAHGHADDARPVAARLLPPGVGRADHGRLRARLRAVVARRDSRGLQREAARGGLAAVRGADGERDRSRPLARGDGGRQADQRARGVHARRRVHPRAVRGARVLGRGGVLRPRARRRRRDGAARRGVDRRGNAVARRLAHGLAAFRRRLPVAGVHARPHEGGLRDLLRRQVPGSRAQAGRPLRVSPAYERLGELGAAFGEKSGWERANWFEPNAANGDESLRPRGWAGKHWSPAIGAEHARLPRDGGAVRRVVVREARRHRRRRGRVPRALCANRVAREVGRVTYTQMLNARGGIECDSR